MRNPKDALRDEDRQVQATYLLLDLYVASNGLARQRLQAAEVEQRTGFGWELLSNRMRTLSEFGYAVWEAGMGLSLEEPGVIEAERLIHRWLQGKSAGDLLPAVLEPAHAVLLRQEWERVRVLHAAYEASEGEPMVRVYPDEFGVWTLGSDALYQLEERGFFRFPESRTFQVTEQGAAYVEEVRSWYPKSDPPTWTFEEFCQRYEAWVRRPEAPTESVFRRDGETWSVVYEGKECSLPHSIGMTYIAHLLANPEKGISVDVLRSLTASTDLGLGDGAEVVDRIALQEYRERLIDIPEERHEATEREDFDRIAELDQEEVWLLKQIGQGTGSRGRLRQMGDDHERCRQSVTRAIRRARDVIAENHESLGVHLRNSLRIRAVLRYIPDRPIRWSS